MASLARKWLKYLAASLGAVAVVLLAALSVFVLTFDPNDYRVLIEDEISEAIGREVLVTGDLEIAPALVPTLAVNEATIANPPWARQPTFASVGRLEVTIALLPLLENEIQIRNVVLERVDALLERNAEGRGNWEFDFLTDSETAAQSAAQFRTRIGAIELRDIDVRYVNADGTDLSTHVEQVTLQHLLISGS
jgi:uncharacterized protein involved in outer membrane biogenesis